MDENNKYWAKEVIEIAGSSLLQIKKIENKVLNLKQKIEDFLREIKEFDESCAELDGIDFDLNLIIDILKREMKNGKSGNGESGVQ